MSALAIRYLILGSRLAASSSVNLLMSIPCAGSWVTSRAVTMPPYHGVWSLVESWCSSPMVPSLALLRLGNAALIWSRRVSRERATRQVMRSLSVGGHNKAPATWGGDGRWLWGG